MIGMPRITLIRPPLSSVSARTPETRIKAHSSPRTVERASEPMVTTIVSQTPCSRIGRNSAASFRNFCIGSDHGRTLLSGGLWLQAPFVENLVEDAVRLQLGERGVDLAEQLGIALADSDRDRADGGRLVGIDQTHVAESALLEVVGQDRIIREAGLEAT